MYVTVCPLKIQPVFLESVFWLRASRLQFGDAGAKVGQEAQRWRRRRTVTRKCIGGGRAEQYREEMREESDMGAGRERGGWKDGQETQQEQWRATWSPELCLRNLR